MSDSKKPKLSEIRARAGNPFPSNTGQMLLADIPHLLDLVERMGKSLEGALWASEKERWEARALLEEIKQ